MGPTDHKTNFHQKPKTNLSVRILLSFLLVLICGVVTFTVIFMTKNNQEVKNNQEAQKTAVLGARVKITGSIPIINRKKFNDKNFYACIIGNLNEYKINNFSGRLFFWEATAQELKALKKLECQSYVEEEEIIDLTGLGEMPNLESLYLSRNSFTDLDLSNQKSLKLLELDGVQINKLDLSTNTALERLAVGSPFLTSLDLSANTALERLIIDKSLLTSLDISNNTSLKNLNINRTDITILDVSNNTNLVELLLSDNKIVLLKGLDKLKQLNRLSLYNNSDKVSFEIMKGNKPDKAIATEKNIFITPGHTIGSLELQLGGLSFAPEMSINSDNGEENQSSLSQVSLGSDYLIKTGDSLKKLYGSQFYGGKFIVLGDATGDGKVQSNDVIKAYRYYKQNQQDPNSLDFLSADVTHDGKVQSNDVIKIYRYYKGTVDSLW